MRDLEYERLAKFKAWSAHRNTVNAILPNALQPLCGCPPCGWHQLAPVHCWWAAPWKHRGSRAESHTSERPQSHASPTETDHQKHSTSVTNQTVYYSCMIWPVYCLQLYTWKCGWLSMCDSSAAVLLWCVKGLSSLRISCTSSTLLSLTASSRVSSRLSAL